MKLNELQPTAGSRRDNWRKGRGEGSGNGKTAGKGHKGQNSRTSGGVRLGFEGGQLPLFRALPKRGFNNVNRKEFEVVNVSVLNNFKDGSEVTPESLKEAGYVSCACAVKVLGNGEISKKLTVSAHAFSKKAEEAIVNAGGTVKRI